MGGSTDPVKAGHEQVQDRPGDDPLPADEDGYSGFVILRLSPKLPPGSSDDLKEVAAELDLPALAQQLEELGDVPTERLITGVSVDALLKLEDEAKDGELPPLHSLTSYWRIDLRTTSDGSKEVVERLNRLAEVDLAYQELAAGDASGVVPVDDPLSMNQGYLNGAQEGINARWAWTQPNGSGAGVGFVDLEQGWITNHEDLAAKNPTLVPAAGQNRHGTGGWIGDHGTAVLGVVVGVDNALGVVGIATGVTSVGLASHWNGATGGHVANAIAAAILTMAAGDVLLLEVGRAVRSLGDALPTEVDEGDFDAIRLAVTRGIIVVEAAGNGSANLDVRVVPNMGEGHPGIPERLHRNNPATFKDSGAIMVGAAESVASGNPRSHNRLESSCYGSRVDCYAWGNNIVTAGYGGQPRPGPPPPPGTPAERTRYTQSFGGTSGAAAMIAGAALVVQSMYRGRTGVRLWPAQMRALLSDRSTGTPQGAIPPGNIGVMPDLQRVATRSGMLPDVYLRDHIGDSGAIPSAGAAGLSPDIIVAPSPVSNPQHRFGELDRDVDTLGFRVESGQDNTIYVRMRNRGAGTASQVKATVYWSEVATLVSSSSWRRIGTTDPPITVLPANVGPLTVAPGLTWGRNDLPPNGRHACLVAFLDSAEDPAPPLPAPTDWNRFVDMVRNHNNVAWRNFVVVNDIRDLSGRSAMLEFMVTGAPDEDRTFDLEILQDLPEGAALQWQVAPELLPRLPRWLRSAVNGSKDEPVVTLPRLPAVPIDGVVLPVGARFPCRFVLEPTAELAHGQHRIAIRQLWDGIEVGRVTWAIEADRKPEQLKPEAGGPASMWRRCGGLWRRLRTTCGALWSRRSTRSAGRS